VRDTDSLRRPLVAVTGGAGYVGSVVVRELLARGHRVRVLDNYLYGDAALGEVRGHPGLETIEGDIRRREDLDRALTGAWGVLHLAGLVGDPACALDPALTLAVNQHSTTTVAEACLAHGVERVLFASTCSVYGAAGEGWLDEEAATVPVSLYAETNLRAEDILRARLAGGPALALLRFATIFGLSPRMRFDLVVNLLAARALATGALEVHGGEQWRPQVHVHDVARALCLGLEQPAERAAGVMNVGSNDLNLRIHALAERVAACFPGTRLTVRDVRDPRSYRVAFDRLRERWGFRPEHDLEGGVREVAAFLRARGVDPEEPRFHNVRALEAHLRRTPS
jgi:nucleoside-diphosphate-sugar epimerase